MQKHSSQSFPPGMPTVDDIFPLVLSGTTTEVLCPVEYFPPNVYAGGSCAECSIYIEEGIQLKFQIMRAVGG